MKKMILCFMAVCTAMTMQAQEIDWTGLTIFAEELEALQDEHVSCDTMTHRELLDYLDTEIVCVFDADTLLAKLDKKDFRLIKILSHDGIGRESIYKVLDKYEVTTAEVLFGIPLLISSLKRPYRSLSRDCWSNEYTFGSSPSFFFLSVVMCSVVLLKE